MAGLRGNIAGLAFAKQTAKGTPNTEYDHLLPFTGGSIAPTREVDNLSETDANRDRGVSFVQTTGVEGSPEVYVRDNSIHDLFEAVLGSKSTVWSSPNATHTLSPANSLSYYTFFSEVGDTLWEQFTDCKVSELTLSADAGQPLTAALNIMGLEAERLTSEPTQPSVNEVQSLTVDATGGTYTMTFSGQTTAAIAYNAAASAVQSALEALSNISDGEVVVAGGVGAGGGGTPYTITFRGQYQGQNVATITTNAGSLTGGASTATITTTTPGVAGLPALASGAVYNYNEATVTLAGGATSLVSGFELSISNNVTTQQTDDAIPYDVVEGLREVSLGFTLIFESLTEYNKFHYGGASGTAQDPDLYETSASFIFAKGANNSIQFDIDHLVYQEFPVEPDPGGDPITVDVRAVAERNAVDNVLDVIVKNQNPY